MTEYIASTAVVKGDYRYVLRREWFPGGGQKVMFIMLNPSTADARKDDPTIKRCVGFAKAWGYSGLYVGNMFAWRATDPRELPSGIRAIGPSNGSWLRYMARQSSLIIAAWGSNRRVAERAEILRGQFKLRCLGVNKDGQPCHPLYLPGDAEPRKWAGAAAHAWKGPDE